MVLNVRERQIDAVVRLLHFNAPSGAGGKAQDEAYKVLILDDQTKDIIAPLLPVSELRRHGVTLHLVLEGEREPIPDVPAVYLVRPSESTVDRIAQDCAAGLYDSLHLNFSTHLSRPLLERLASRVAASGSGAGRVARVHDQYLQYTALEPGLFTLDLPATYVHLHDPQARDSDIEACVEEVVDRLFCVLATSGSVPVLACPRGGAAEHVARRLETRLRDALRARSNVFGEVGGGGVGAGLHRPLLALFDRSFELSVMLQHVWTYKPLLQDVMGLKRNRVSVAAEGEPGQGVAAAAQQRHYQVDEGDFFWQGNGLKPFPAVAEQVEVELARYRASVEELNRQTGANVDPLADSSELMGSSTKNLMSAISSLPQLTEQKRVIDKHTNLATALLGAIKARALDRFYELAEELVGGKGGLDAVLKALQPAAPGLPGDKLRLALVWLLTAQPAPQEAEAGRVEEALRGLGVDARAFAYVWRMRRLNLTGKAHAAPSVAEGLVSLGAGSAQLGNLLGSTFGQGLSSLTKGVKSLLAGEQQAAVTVALEALMDSRPRPETESFLLLDPRGQPGQPTHVSGGFREAIVFMLGGGNYLEAESLACWASRAQPAPKHVVYGATDLLSGDEFVQQLAQLAAMSGTG